MRKFIGWLMIVFCSIILLPIVMVLIMIVMPGLLPRTAVMGMSVSEIISVLPGFLIVSAILIFGLVKGIKRVRKKTVTDNIEYTDELDLHLTGQIAYKDYRNLIMGMTFKKPIFLVYIGIFVVAFFSFKGNNEDLLVFIKSNPFILVLIGVFIISPVFALTQIKKLYHSNKILHERVAYSLSNESIYLQSESVDSIQKWTNFMKVKETKRFFMLYQGNNSATILDKKMFADNEVVEFQRFLQSLNIIY